MTSPSALPAVAVAASAACREMIGASPDVVWFAPGRVNVIGEHTDYNEGFVLPLALPYGTAAAVGRRGDGVLRARSRQEDAHVDVALTELEAGSVQGWGAYVAGVIWALLTDGHELPGLDVAVSGDVPPGAGLSSSHSLECAVAAACNDLFHLGMDRTTLARLVQRAENQFVGAPTGLMDQMASLHGRGGHLIFLDCRTLEIEPVPFDLDAHGLALVVIDTRTPHAHVDGAYADRRAACEHVARILGVPALRDVPIARLADAMAHIDDDVLRRRARHVITENARVLRVVDLLRRGDDQRAIGADLTASHISMRDDFAITDPRVDLAVDAALTAGAHGARMTGGGFGGSAIALVPADQAESIGGRIGAAFGAEGLTAPQPFAVTAGPAAARDR